MVGMDNHLANGSAASANTAAADCVDSASASDSTCDLSEVRHWRAALESRWTMVLEEAILLSRACDEAWQAGAHDTPDPGNASLARIMARTERAYQDLADIGAAIDKLDTGSFGICEGCGRPMSPDWLADEPQVRQCPDCALLLVRWRPTSARTAVTPMRASTRAPKSTGMLKSGVAASAAGQPPHRERRLSVVAS